MGACIKVISWKCTICGKIHDLYDDANCCCLSDEEIQDIMLDGFVKEYNDIIKECPINRDNRSLYEFYTNRNMKMYSFRDRYILALRKYNIMYYSQVRNNVLKLSLTIDDLISENFRKAGNYMYLIRKENNNDI